MRILTATLSLVLLAGAGFGQEFAPGATHRLAEAKKLMPQGFDVVLSKLTGDEAKLILRAMISTPAGPCKKITHWMVTGKVKEGGEEHTFVAVRCSNYADNLLIGVPTGSGQEETLIGQCAEFEKTSGRSCWGPVERR